MKRLWYRIQGGPFIVFLLTLFLIAVIGLLGGQQPAQAGPPLQGDSEDHSGQSCGECHLDHKAAWETGVHAIAYDRASFQDAWAEADHNPDCLQCHTTNYHPNTGQYDAENIQCEACHGQNPPNHPPETLVVNTEAEMCGDCHTSTFAEWEHSPHAFTEDMGAIGCATCHNPHGQTLRFDTVNDLCLNCHESAPNTYVHLTHNEIDIEGVDVTCASCHMDVNPQGDDIHHLPNHEMTVETDACTNCHEALSASGNVPLLVDVDTQLAEQRDALRQQVEELQAQLEAVSQEAEKTSGTDYVQLTQGLILGLGLGITIIWVIMRRDNGNNKSKKQ